MFPPDACAMLNKLCQASDVAAELHDPSTEVSDFPADEAVAVGAEGTGEEPEGKQGGRGE